MKKHFTCGFIGLGLIGGSIARAFRQFYPACHLMAWDKNTGALRQATIDGVLNTPLTSIGTDLQQCDYLFLCAPVSENTTLLPKIKKYLSPNCLLTDVGSVKKDIHIHVKNLGLEKQFIGGHPMAGSERTGYINSKAILLENAYYVLTPGEGCPMDKIQDFSDLVASFGAIPLVLNCDQHDYITAAVSHLPHIAASSLVNLIRESDSSDGLMKMIAAGGFKDITRIASSSPIMWQQICLANGSNISALLEQFIHVLTQMKKNIDSRNQEALYDFFDDARTYRDSFIDASSGPIKKSYAVQIEIADKPGALASIAAALAQANISIKNIGIAHNREQTDGVLQVEFHQADSIAKACELLQSQGYAVYQKN